MIEAVESQDPEQFVSVMLEYYKDASEQDMQRLKNLLHKSITVLTQRIRTELTKTTTSDSMHIGETIIKEENVQFSEPRGRFTISLGNEGLHIGGKPSLLVNLKKIDNICSIPCNTAGK